MQNNVVMTFKAVQSM